MLVPWNESPLYVAVIVSVLAVVPVGVYMTEQVTTAPDPVRAQGDPVMVPVPLLVTETVPDGVP